MKIFKQIFCNHEFCVPINEGDEIINGEYYPPLKQCSSCLKKMPNLSGQRLLDYKAGRYSKEAEIGTAFVLIVFVCIVGGLILTAIVGLVRH